MNEIGLHTYSREVHLSSLLHTYHVTVTWLIHVNITPLYISSIGTGWRRPIGCLKLQVIFCKRATNYRALLRRPVKIMHSMGLRYPLYDATRRYHLFASCVHLVWHDSFTWDTTHPNVTWLIRIWHDSSICDITHPYVTWLSHMQHDSPTHVLSIGLRHARRLHLRASRASHMCVTHTHTHTPTLPRGYTRRCCAR